MKRLQRTKRFSLFSYHLRLFQTLLIFLTLFFNCNKTGEDPAYTLTKFFNLINGGSYKKAASLCLDDVDPYLLDFTNVVTLRFIGKIIVKEQEMSRDRATFYVFLVLKDGKQLAYYRRTKEGDLVPGVMKLRKVTLGNKKHEWRLVCDEFWETHRWQDISRKARLNVIKLAEKVIQYRDSQGFLPGSLSMIWSESLDSIINPVTGNKEVFVVPEQVKPGVISFYYDSERDEVDIKGYDAMGEQLDYFIVSHSRGVERAEILEFFDVPPITITTVIPAYPESEREKGIEGVVSLRLLIGRDGMVQEVKVESHLSPLFDSVAIEAVKHSVFSPAKRDGKPVAVWYYFPVRFVLTE